MSLYTQFVLEYVTLGKFAPKYYKRLSAVNELWN